VLYRCGIAHNWAGVITRTTHELAAAETRLTEGLRISSSIPSDRSRFNLALSNTLINRYEWHGNAPDLDAALATARQSIEDSDGNPILHSGSRSGLARVLLACSCAIAT
jgi:hypothetical protein